MKLFKTSNIEIVNDCQVYFGFDLPSVIIVGQSKKFLSINATCTVSLLSQFSRFLLFMYIVLPRLVK